MQKSLMVPEFKTPLWKYLTIFSFLTAVTFAVAFWASENPLWEGIFRLIAFATFAGSVLAGFRWREKLKMIQFELTEKQLKIHYLLGDEELKEELFEIKTIKNIEVKEISTTLIKENPQNLTITFTDTDTALSMLTFGGRDLRLSSQDATRVEDFFISHNIGFSNDFSG